MKIKNWHQFQHYKRGKNAARHPEWLKLYRKLLDDIEWHQLDGLDAKVLVMLWMLASESGGTLPPINVIAFRLRLPEKQINSVLQRLPHWIEDDPSGVLGNAYTETRLEEEKEREEEKKDATHPVAHFDVFWDAYPHKVGKEAARKAFRQKNAKAPLNEILAGVERYKRDKPPDRNWCNPATWLNQERWLDEPATTGPPRSPVNLAYDRVRAKIEGMTNGNGRHELRPGGRPLLARQPSEQTARPGDTAGTTDDPFHGEAEGIVAEDGSPRRGRIA